MSTGICLYYLLTFRFQCCFTQSFVCYEKLVNKLQTYQYNILRINFCCLCGQVYYAFCHRSVHSFTIHLLISICFHYNCRIGGIKFYIIFAGIKMIFYLPGSYIYRSDSFEKFRSKSLVHYISLLINLICSKYSEL